MHDLNQDAGRRFLERPNHMHPFRPRFQMMEMNFELFAIDDLLRGPRDRKAGARGGHDDEIAILAALEIPNITIVRQDLRPQLEVCRCFENLHFRRVNDDGISRVHLEGLVRIRRTG